MANDSSTGGYLLPIGPSLSPEDDALTDALQAMVQGVTGLPGPLVRPRWTVLPPAQPPATTNWCAIGVVEEAPDTYAYIQHDAAAAGGLGTNTQQRHQGLTLLASFYGPAGQGYARRLTTGLLISQNREAMGLVGIRLVATGPARHVPEEVNNQWIPRVDVEVYLRRILEESYAVRNIATIQVQASTPTISSTNTFSG